MPRCLILLALLAAGCGTQTVASKPDRVAGERDKLAEADRAAVEAQEWCVVSRDERLGSMGPPVKIDVKGTPVFLCCTGCKAKAEADPDATLEHLAALRAKKAAASK